MGADATAEALIDQLHQTYTALALDFTGDSASYTLGWPTSGLTC